VAATFVPHCLTASRAALDVACSRMILRLVQVIAVSVPHCAQGSKGAIYFGKSLCSIYRVGRNLSSAFITVISTVEGSALEGHSPCKFNLSDILESARPFEVENSNWRPLPGASQSS